MNEKALFTSLLRDAGVPTREAEVREAFEKEVIAEDVAFSNNSEFSPWWRMITRLVTLPVMWLIEALTSQVLPQVFVKTATGRFLGLLANGVNLERKAARKAEGRVQFTRAAPTGALSVPAGTRIRSANINGHFYELVTTAAVAFVEGESTALAPVVALEAGSAYNLAAGYYAALPVPVNGIVAVTNLDNWLTVPGADEEDDDALRQRVRNQFLAVNQWHTDAVYRSLISSFEGVNADNVFFDSDAPRGPGTADAFVLFETGNPDASFIAQIQHLITDDGNHGHGDDLKVFAMPETVHDVTANVWAVDTLTAQERTDLVDGVEQMIRAAFRENQDYSPTRVLPFARFSFSRLSQELHSQFAGLSSIDFEGSDIVSTMNVPRLNALQVVLHD